MARHRKNTPKSNGVLQLITKNSQNTTNTPHNNNTSGSRFASLHREDESLADLGIIEEPVSILRPFNLSNGMESILEEDSEDASDWEEVPRRGQSSRSETSPRVRPLQLTDSDVNSELSFWSTAVYCYVLEANPPFKVIDSFVKRIWGYTDYDKSSFNYNGIFLVRFKTKEMKLRVLQSGPVFFENKPVVVKEWTPNTKLVREAVDMVPIWIRFYGLPLKFWGNALQKIAGLVGKPLRTDSNTQLKTFLGHARVMVEVPIAAELPDVIEFTDEFDVVHSQIVHYEWKPTKCEECNGLGHLSRDCRKKKTRPVVRKKVWVPKPPRVEVPPVVEARVQSPTPAEAHGTTEIVMPTPSQPMPVIANIGGIEGFGGLVTPMPASFHSFTLARIITKLTRQGGIAVGSARRTFLEVLEHYVQYRRILEEEMEESSSNLEHGSGGRIWILWDANNYDVVVLRSEARVIHAKVAFLPTGGVWWMSVIYGFNRIAERIPLWQSLKEMHYVVNGPWIAMGDFNNVLAMSERIGSEVTVAELKGFQECVADCGLLDLPAQGAFFTWNNKHEPGAMVFSRLDRAMVNDEWLLHFPETTTVFHPEGLFYHCPCTINMSNEPERRKSGFKYFNMWGKVPEFTATVHRVWDTQIPGYKMFQLVKKLKLLKPSLKQLNGEVFGNIETSANVAKMYLQKIQTKLHSDPKNVILQQTEKEAAVSYKELEEARRSFLYQRYKAQWMEDGDENT
ncbi:uncharacterized protein LOC141651698 [Silene latifolia]|uniref:uncharacterized protein LOC141651698 n=1 Tax=Silene latifolia TaxID=37657 RepID=UPI003D77ED7E